MIGQLKVFKNRLSDFSGSSKSLLQKRLRKNQDLDWNDLNFLDLHSSFELLKQLVAGKERILVCKIADPRDESTNLVSSKIKQINRLAQLIFQERGTYDLKIGYPFVHGTFNATQSVRCPLLFFNITLCVEGNFWVIKQEQDPTFNPVFIKAYRHHLQKKVMDVENELEHENHKEFMVNLIAICKKMNLDLRFSREMFEERLLPFENFQKNELAQRYGIGILNVVNEAVLGLYPSNLAQIEQDYDWLIENNKFENLEELFFSLKKESKKTKEENAIFPFETDSSQEEALLRIKKGDSLVIQGPPGTGKSQLIANLMADCMANGKSALLVCDKKVALDVIAQRLQQKKLDQFLAVVHDYQMDRSVLFKKIAHNINQIDEIKSNNNHFSTIQLERDFNFCSREIDHICEQLQQHKSALFDDKKFGISPKELFLTTDFNATTLNPEWLEQTVYEEWLKLSNTANYWFLMQKKIEEQAPHWKKRKHRPTLLFSNSEQLKDLVASWADLLEQTPKNYHSIEKLSSIAENVQDLESISGLLQDNAIKQLAKSEHFQKNKLISLRKWVNQLETSTHLTIKKMLFDELKSNLKLLKTYFGQQKFQRFWSKLTHQKLQQNIKLAKELYAKPDLTKLAAEFESMVEFHQFCESIQIDFQDPSEKLNSMSNIISKTIQLFDCLSNCKPLGISKQQDLVEIEKQTIFWLHLHKQFVFIHQKCALYFDDLFLEETNPSNYIDIINELDKNFELIAEQNKIECELKKHELEIIKSIYEKGYYSGFGDQVFNALKKTAIEILEKKHPELCHTTNGRIEWLENELNRLMNQKMDTTLAIAQLRTSEESYKDIKKNRLGNTVTFRDLLHECEKKRKLLSARQLVERHFDELKKIVPCWAVSPSTASAIFPIEKTSFDLVIFDEASQCFAEEALPIIFRAKQLVVVGDMKQLPPNTLYAMREDFSENDEIDLQIDSWLGLCQRHLPTLMLKGHYRSRHLELMSFSNQHFYENKLQLIPEFQALKKQHSALKFKYIENGIWENNSNRAEAIWIAEQLTYALKNNPKNESFGVITMNFHQQQLIWEMLEQKAIEDKSDLNNDTIFIKNIENVQGDEADHIFISLAYAKDRNGNVRANFGLLNQEQGENRLNVCITRARNSLTLVSSLLPHEIPHENAKHQGPKLLAAFASFVFQMNNLSHEAFQEIHPFQNKTAKSHSLKEKLLEQPNFKPSAFSDLEEFDGKDFKNLVLTDDNIFEKETVKGFHFHFQQTLLKKGWPLKKKWSRAFWISKS